LAWPSARWARAGWPGALILARLRPGPAPYLLIAAGALASALGVGLLGAAALAGLLPGLLAICLAFAALGLAGSAVFVPTRSLMQAHVAPDRMGRVTALGEAGSALAILVAPFLGAALAARFGTGAAFLAGAGLMALVALLAARLARR
jgi:MFS family permease